MSSEVVTTLADIGTGGATYIARKGFEKTSPKKPNDPVNPGAMPSPEDAATAQKMKEAESQQRRARSRAATILTSGQGVSAGPSTSARRTLLGS